MNSILAFSIFPRLNGPPWARSYLRTWSKAMKDGIHPDYMSSTIVCACGNRVDTMSTQEEIHVEICSVCHPFYTGKQKLVDTAGRVDRYKKKYDKAST